MHFAFENKAKKKKMEKFSNSNSCSCKLQRIVECQIQYAKLPNGNDIRFMSKKWTEEDKIKLKGVFTQNRLLFDNVCEKENRFAFICSIIIIISYRNIQK